MVALITILVLAAVFLLLLFLYSLMKVSRLSDQYAGYDEGMLCEQVETEETTLP